MKNLVDLIKESFINTDINEYDNYIIEGLNIDPDELGIICHNRVFF